MSEVYPYISYLTNGAGTITGTVCLRQYNSSRRNLMIQNLGTGVLYIGGTGVTEQNGLKVLPNGDMSMDNSSGAAIYVTSTGTTSIRFLEDIS